jgi:hypothetical protein
MHPHTIRKKYNVMFLQYFSQLGRKWVQEVSTSQEELRMSFLNYIAGRMPESDRARFEEQLLEDQDFSDAAAGCEQELIDGYALHRLDTEETRAVGLWIEASPERVERVAMARALLKTPSQRNSGRLQVGIAMAVAACLAIATTLYLVNTRGLHRASETTQLSAANSALPRPEAPGAVANPTETAKPDVILIAAERIRGKPEITTYRVHPESPIQLQVLLPGETAHSGYQIRVSPLAGQSKILLQQSDLTAQSMAGQLYLTVTLSPGSLPPGTYTASISRQNETLTSTFSLKWMNQ